MPSSFARASSRVQLGVISVVGVVGVGLVGCLDAGPGAPVESAVTGEVQPDPVATDRADLARLSGALEGEATVDEGALAECAAVGNACLEAGGSPAPCIDDYVTCVVAGGVPADHPYLVCLGTLSTCWRAAGEDAGALDACVTSYDTCVGQVVEEGEPTEPGEPTDPREPTDPDEPTDPRDAALGACERDANVCFEQIGTGEVTEASCTAGYRECIVAAGVSVEEPYVVCLDTVLACLGGAGEDSSGCWDSFDTCVYVAYPAEEEPAHEPAPEPEYALCEEPVVDCYEAGGSNVECIGVYRSCLLGEGWTADDARILCLDALIACAGPAEASADPDAALEVCADDFNTCIGYPGY